MEFTFTLKFKLNTPEITDEDIALRLGEAGCTDALVGLGVTGQVSLEFIREANTAQEAILTALAAVKQALPQAQLIEAAPDWVGLTEVADLMGVSRQNMRQLMLHHAQEFPVPIHTGNASVWHLAQVLDFMNERRYPLTHTLRDVARTTMQINIAKQQMLVDTRLQHTIAPDLLA